jgi:2'-5' RNA ligase
VASAPVRPVVDDWVDIPLPVSQASDEEDWVDVPPVAAAPAAIAPPPASTGPRKRNEGAGKPPAGYPTYLPPGGVPPIIQGALGVEGQPTSIPGQVVKAGAEMAESLALDPVNVGIQVATGGLGLLSKLPLLKAALPKAISVGFSAQMLQNAYEQSKEFRDAVDKGNYPRAAHALTSGVLNTVLSAMGIRHAAGIGEKVAPIRTNEEQVQAESKVEPKVAPAEDWIDVPPEKSVQVGQTVKEPKVASVQATPVQQSPQKAPTEAAAQEVPVEEPQPPQPVQLGAGATEVPPVQASVPESVPGGSEKSGVPALQSTDSSAPAEPAADQSPEKPKIDIPRAKDLRPEEREAETRYIEKIQADPDAVIDQYRKANTKNGTLTINTDNARELSDDYSASNEGRTAYARAVHEPSSWVSKKVFEQALKEPAPDGLANDVVFTGGGTGAGKSVSAEHFDPDTPPQIIYDTNLNNFESAKAKFDQALAAGKKVKEYFVDRGILPSFESMLHRATRMGRPVPIENHIETHMGAAKTTLELIDHYKDDPRVTIRIVDNNGSSPADSKIVSPDTLKGREYNGVREQLEQAADRAYEDGRISAEVYKAVRGKSPEGLRRSVPAEPAELVVPGSRGAGGSTRYGRQTEILIPGSQDAYHAIYSVRELDDVHASHSGQTFQANPKYELANDRDYSDKRNSGRILSQAGDFKPQYLLTDAPDALNGAPIIDSRGNVLGGNSRTMTIDRVYAQKPGAAAKYRQQLLAQAKTFGIDPAAVAAMKRPVLVRELHGEYKAQKAVTDFNVAGTAALTPAERAVADSHRVSVKTLDEVAKRIEDQGPDGTLAKALSGDGRALVNRLIEDGAVAAQDKPALLNPDGTLTAEGKSRLSRLLIGRLFEDSKQFDSTPAELRNKLERIVAPLARVEGKDEWDIGPQVKQAISLINESKSRDMGIDDLLAQGGMFDQSEYSPAVVAIAKTLGGKATEVSRAFRDYASEAEMATTGTDAGIDTRLLTAEIPTQLEAFNDAFKAKLTEPIEKTAPKTAAESVQPGQIKEAEKAPATPEKEVVQPKPSEKPEEAGAAKEEKAEPEHSSTQIDVPTELAGKIKDAAAKLIPDADLADKGREEEPHVTVLYGLEGEDPKEVADLLKGEKPIKAKIQGVSIFPAKEAGDYDVVKLDIDSPDLRRLNTKLKQNLPYTSDYPDYKPHVTLAYVKAGTGKKYAGRVLKGVSGETITVPSVTFSAKDGTKTEIPLGVKPGGEASKPSVQPGQEGKETKPSKLAQGVEEKAIANKLTQGFEGKPEYETVKVDEQAKMAGDLIKSDPEKAVRIAMGAEDPPEGLLPESIFVAVEDYATANKDVDLLRELATTSTLSSEATAMGQRIRMLGERDPNSPVAAIQKVTKAREEAAAKRYGPKAKDKIKEQIRVEVKLENRKPKNWADFISSITCK